MTKPRFTDILIALSLIGSACGVHLFYSENISSLYIFLVCIALYYTKNIYPYLALTIFVAGTPANFMFVQDFEVFPNFPFLAAISLTLTLKFWKFRKMIINIFAYKTVLRLFICFTLILILIGLIIGVGIENSPGYGLTNYVKIIRFLLLLPLIVLIPFIINNIDQAFRTLPLLEIIILVNIALNFFHSITGFHINDLFNNQAEIFGISEDFNSRAKTGWLYSSIYTPLLIFLRFFKRIPFLRFFIGISLSILSASFTGSRGHLGVILLLTFLSLIFLINKKDISKILSIAVIAIIFFPKIIANNVIEGRIDLYNDRFFNKSVTLSSDQLRNTYAENVIAKFKESPVIGFGYSSEGLKYYDQHSGNQSIALSGGLVGIFIYALLTWHILIIMFNSSKGFNKLFILKCLVILSFFLLHSTSTDLFSPYFAFKKYHYNKFILIAFIFTFLSIDRKGCFTKSIKG